MGTFIFVWRLLRLVDEICSCDSNDEGYDYAHYFLIKRFIICFFTFGNGNAMAVCWTLAMCCTNFPGAWFPTKVAARYLLVANVIPIHHATLYLTLFALLLYCLQINLLCHCAFRYHNSISFKPKFFLTLNLLFFLSLLTRCLNIWRFNKAILNISFRFTYNLFRIFCFNGSRSYGFIKISFIFFCLRFFVIFFIFHWFHRLFWYYIIWIIQWIIFILLMFLCFNWLLLVQLFLGIIKLLLTSFF